MITKKQKEEIVGELTKKFAEEKIAIFSRVHGVSVARLSVFRRELKKIGAEIKIAKKTLTQRAIDAANIPTKIKELEGEVGVIFGYQDNQTETAKLTQKFQKANETFKILLGLFDGKVISREQVLMLAKLPPREQLLAQLAGVLATPLRNIMNVLQGNQRNLVVVLQKIINNK